MSKPNLAAIFAVALLVLTGFAPNASAQGVPDGTSPPGTTGPVPDLQRRGVGFYTGAGFGLVGGGLGQTTLTQHTGGTRQSGSVDLGGSRLAAEFDVGIEFCPQCGDEICPTCGERPGIYNAPFGFYNAPLGGPGPNYSGPVRSPGFYNAPLGGPSGPAASVNGPAKTPGLYNSPFGLRNAPTDALFFPRYFAGVRIVQPLGGEKSGNAPVDLFAVNVLNRPPANFHSSWDRPLFVPHLGATVFAGGGFRVDVNGGLGIASQSVNATLFQFAGNPNPTVGKSQTQVFPILGASFGWRAPLGKTTSIEFNLNGFYGFGGGDLRATGIDQFGNPLILTSQWNDQWAAFFQGTLHY